MKHKVSTWAGGQKHDVGKETKQKKGPKQLEHLNKTIFEKILISSNVFALLVPSVGAAVNRKFPV